MSMVPPPTTCVIDRRRLYSKAPLARHAGYSLSERGGRPEDPQCRLTEIFGQLAGDDFCHGRFETGTFACLRRRTDTRVHQHAGGLKAGGEFADHPPFGATPSACQPLRILADFGQHVVKQAQDCRGVAGHEDTFLRECLADDLPAAVDLTRYGRCQESGSQQGMSSTILPRIEPCAAAVRSRAGRSG